MGLPGHLNGLKICHISPAEDIVAPRQSGIHVIVAQQEGKGIWLSRDELHVTDYRLPATFVQGGVRSCNKRT